MRAENHYHIFRIENSGTIGYIADGPANGRMTPYGITPCIENDLPAAISFQDEGGLTELAETLSEAHTFYLKKLSLFDLDSASYLGFSFGPPVQVAMFNTIIWQTASLSDAERTTFLQEIKKQYSRSIDDHD